MNPVILRPLVAAVLAVGLAGCVANSAPPPEQNPASGAAATSEDEGASFEHAVVLADAKTESQGVRAEHEWVETHCPGWAWGSQYLLNHEGRVYDMIEISRGGEQRKIYFDISNWFGHME